MSKTAKFTNFTDEEFTGYYDGKPRVFKVGDSMYLPDKIARHFAKHLTNRELLRTDDEGKLIYKDGDKFTSPKRPADVPMFMELFGKAFSEEEGEMIEDGSKDLSSAIDATNKNKEVSKKKVVKDEEDEFKGKPVEEKPKKKK